MNLQFYLQKGETTKKRQTTNPSRGNVTYVEI